MAEADGTREALAVGPLGAGADGPPREWVAPRGGSLSGFQGEIAGLLHYRLRVVCLIALFPCLLFLLRDLGDSGPWPMYHRVGLALHGLVVLVLGTVSWALWRGRGYSLGLLRRLELVLFGTLAGFFGYLQFMLF